LYDKNRKKFSNDDLARAIRTKEDIFDKEGKIIDSETLNVVYERLEENNADYNLNNKPAWQQSIIILAGVFMNFMLAILIFSVLFFI
jgi:membrane-associated protease RseP (regulator of RpoE activity)